MKTQKDYTELKNLIGGHALRALLRGRYLQIWRRSTPHNWFIETYDGKGFLWHSDDGHDRKLPNLSLFKKVKDSKTKMLRYWGSDSGMPELSLYRLVK